MSTVKLTAASGGGSVSLKGPASSAANVDLLDTSGNLNLEDNKKLVLGTGDDLQVYHDAGGWNQIVAVNDHPVQIKTATENMIKATPNGAVELYYDNSKKINTTNDGATVTGNLFCSEALQLNDSKKIQLGSDQDLDFYHDGSHGNLINKTGNLYINASSSDTAIVCKPDSSVDLYHNNTKRLETDTAGVTVTSDLTLYKSGGTSSTQLHWYGQGVHQYTLYTTGGNIRWWSQVDSDAIIEFQQDGDIKIDGSYLTGGVDYAEYFESTDGSAIPVGTTVILDNGKVRAATGSETPIGVIRPKTSGTSVTGGSHDLNWKGKYLVDDYDGQVFENATFCSWKEGDEPKQCWKDRPPTGVTIPDDAVETTKSRKKLNPDFDASKTYVPRSERVEWNCVGLLGQIPITKGQPTSTNWIKMKERSSTVELWMVK